MNFTTFNPSVSRIKTFDTIGYDKDKQLLQVLFFDGSRKFYEDVNESGVFKFIIAQDKESHYQDIICNKYKEAGSLSR